MTRFRVRLLGAVVAVLGLVLGTPLPGGAISSGRGTVVGDIAIGGSGIPVATAAPAPIAWAFTTVLIHVSIANTSGVSYTGCVNVNANGASPAENANKGGGDMHVTNIARAACPGGVGPVTTGGNVSGIIGGALDGAYVREKTDVVAVVNGPITINGVTFSAEVTIRGQLVATTGNGVTTNITRAQLQGDLQEFSAAP